MYRPKRWTLADPHPDAPGLADRLKTSPLIAQILLNRGFSDPLDCAGFLRPTFKSLHDPAGIPNLMPAARRIAKAIRDKEKIVIFGDYDVDGITATAILWHAVRLLGGEVDYYIPHRVEEGYGLNPQAIAEICDNGAKLIVTVDCGITALEPAKVARDRGVDLIITDHHEWKCAEEGSGFGVQGSREEGLGEARSAETGSGFRVSGSGEEGARENATADESGLSIANRQSQIANSPQSTIENRPSAIPTPPSSLNPEPRTLNSPTPLLPDCFTIVHPRLPAGGPAYPNPALCGAGVAFKLAWGIGVACTGVARVNDDYRQFLLEATALAALGTIADVVPLVGENRVLAHFGLGAIKQSKLTGIRALIESANLTGQKLDSYHVGFLLAPRLNAAGRMGHARLAVEMLTRADFPRAAEIAVYLEQQNRARQTMEKSLVAEALAQIEERGWGTDDRHAIVVGGEGWHPGVIGIVASRIVDRFHRPAVVVALHDGQGQGSGRSIPGFHLSRAFDACRDHLLSFGGHEMAAGLKVESGKLDAFRDAFVAHAGRSLSADQLTPLLHLECLTELRQVTEDLVKDITRLGPFGNGNRRPLLCCRGLQLAAAPRRVGKTGDHLQLFVTQGAASMKCIAFNSADLFDRLRPGVTIDLAVEPTINDFNGRRTVELAVKDLQFATE